MIPLEIEDGLPYVKGRPYTDDEWLNLPHVELTSPGDWDPSVLDHKLNWTFGKIETYGRISNKIQTLSDSFQNWKARLQSASK